LSDSTITGNSKRWLITLSGGGENSMDALRAGTELALAAGAFGQRVTLVFGGTGLSLLAPQAGDSSELAKLLGSLPYYDIEAVYRLPALEEPETWRDDLNVRPIAPHEWQAVAAEADVVVNY
jgi:hypothetical protein